MIKLNLNEHSTLKYSDKMQTCPTESPCDMTGICVANHYWSAKAY